MNVEKAIAYNRRHNPPDAQRIQCLLQLPASGYLAELDCRAVAAFQLLHGLDVDGMVGAGTLEALEVEELRLWARLQTLGVYWDASAPYTVGEGIRFAEQLKSLGIDHVQTMLDSTSHGRAQWTERQLDVWSDRLQACGISHGITLWAMPDKQRMDARRKALPGLIKAGRVVLLGLDCEEHLLKNNVIGYADRDTAVDDMVAFVREMRLKRPTMVSSYPDLLGKTDRRAARVLAEADYAEMQVYGRAKAADGQWLHPRYGVATAQQWGAGVWRDPARHDEGSRALADGGPVLTLAVAAYNQTYPRQSWGAAPSPEQARYLSTLGALSMDVQLVMDWSWLNASGMKGKTVSDRGEKARYNRAYYLRVKALRERARALEGGCEQ